MAEALSGYPRWKGELKGGSAAPTIAAQEIRLALRDPWVQVALFATLFIAALYLSGLYQVSRSGARFTLQSALELVGWLRWGALAIAAIVGGSALLDDARRGALELYLSRAVTRADYLMGKIIAVFVLTAATMILPIVLYYVAGFFLFDARPPDWEWFLPKVFGYILLWVLMVTGLGFGMSCVARSGLQAAIILFGSFLVVHLIVGDLLIAGLTRGSLLKLASPMQAHGAQVEWIFSAPAPYTFPFEYGLYVLGALMILGWALVAWKHPRLQGES